MKLLSYNGAGAFFWRNRSIIARRSDKEADLARSWPTLAFGPSAESALQVTRKNWHIPTRNECANPTFEFLDNTVRRSCSLREDDQDVASLSEKLTTNRQALADMGLAREW